MREAEIRDSISFSPPFHFINGAPSHTKSSLVKYDTPPPPGVLFFESENMVIYIYSRTSELQTPWETAVLISLKCS